MKDLIRFGAWAAFWGDTPRAARQVLKTPDLDYLISDYLAEITMALLARARAKDPEVGYITEVVPTLTRIMPELHERGIKAITNAGALNARAGAEALQAAADEAGVPLQVAAVEGDDLLPRLQEVLAACPKDIFTGVDVPTELSSLNAYLGATPIARALDAGADIVVTGRCVDAAVVLGPLMHEFGWTDSDYDLLSAGTLVGHIIECGPQSLGGLFTDWADVPGWENMGYPIAEVHRDGSAIITKPPDTGGLVTPGTVSEQILYEIGDPGAYIMPDVVCDWRQVTLEQEGTDRVRVSGAKGSEPTQTYKVTATHQDGYRAMTTAMFAGVDAGGRARRAGNALVARTNGILAEEGYGPLTESLVEVIGTGDTLGADPPNDAAMEVVVKVGVRHPDRNALSLFAGEFAPFSLVAQGMTGAFAGRPRPAPVFRVFHLLAAKSNTPVEIRIGGQEIPLEVASGTPTPALDTPELTEDGSARSANGTAADEVTVPLKTLAYGRSGDKGDKANVGIIARRPEFIEVIRNQVTPKRVAAFFAHYTPGEVKAWELPGLHAINYLIDSVLGGAGGTSTLRYDPQGKSYAAMLLSLPVTVPAAWIRDGLVRQPEVIA
ncbi:MAG: DUF1446 domain-containing protein [Actinomycetia bacterium]|nr:DUF1446 domain-containing protein [Actinomycetes bacterium]